jgi:hypothetical protein
MQLQRWLQHKWSFVGREYCISRLQPNDGLVRGYKERVEQRIHTELMVDAIELVTVSQLTDAKTKLSLLGDRLPVMQSEGLLILEAQTRLISAARINRLTKVSSLFGFIRLR